MTGRKTAEADRQRRRSTKSGVVLDEQKIVDTALRMLEEHGSSGLSARRLGRALGADPTTIYRYFQGMDDLELAVADELIARVTRDWHRTGDWKADLQRWGVSAYTEYLKYPHAAQISAARISGRPAELAGVEAILAALRSAGFPDRLAVLYYRSFIAQMLSYAARDGAKKLVSTLHRGADTERWTSVYAGVSAEQYPNIAATADLLEEFGTRNLYPIALQILLTDMQTALERHRDRAPARRPASNETRRTSSSTSTVPISGTRRPLRP
ncbi:MULTISPECIES: TetR family transcriptional regulator [unclassified Rhodococcus (in: high G+C Gram-positive bacteria)]|uniref:TetR/AcrR family transcriptional regulator n=1 Tax=Rhodococcus sp. SJ-3 TaxID=3454628 RepID=UPI002D87D158|nr:TetR/AcrR family transcriptional regulator [Rhodococcus sp. (in: high G+C Gram-positive bacteria)]